MSHSVDKIMRYTASAFKFCYIVHILLAFCNWLAGDLVMKISAGIVLILGGITLVYRLINIKSFWRYPFIAGYGLFLLLYLITMIINIRYGWWDNAKILIWMTMQLFGLYLFDIRTDKGYVNRELNTSLYILVGLTTIINLIGIVMLFGNYLTYHLGGDGGIYLIGVAPWGRLFGIQADPNYGAAVSAAAIIVGLYLFIRCSRKIFFKIIIIISILIQMLSLAFSASRTGLVSLLAGLAVAAFLYVMYRNKKVWLALLVALTAVLLTFGMNKLIITGYNGYAVMISNIHGSHGGDDSSIDEPITEIDRSEELNGDISNRRFDLWTNALQVIQTRPLMGISFGNIVSFAQQELPESYLIANGVYVFNAFHNMIMDVLACQGIAGFSVLAVIIIWSLVFMIRNIRYLDNDDRLRCIMLLGVCICLAVACMFVSGILYVNNTVTVVFWLMWGYLLNYFARGRKVADNG